jgi:hypothetical protein
MKINVWGLSGSNSALKETCHSFFGGAMWERISLEKWESTIFSAKKMEWHSKNVRVN